MSDLYLSDKERQGFPERGTEDRLSNAEEAFVRRILAHPEVFPKSFWAGVIQKMAIDAELITPSQVQGLPRLNTQVQDALQQIEAQLVSFHPAYVATDETCSSDTFVDLATAGPNLSGLTNGVYLVLFGAHVILSSGTNFGTMTAYANSETPSEDNAITVGGAVGDTIFPIMRAISMVLSSGSNSVSTKYHKGGSSARFSNRWLTAIRFGDA